MWRGREGEGACSKSDSEWVIPLVRPLSTQLSLTSKRSGSGHQVSSAAPHVRVGAGDVTEYQPGFENDLLRLKRRRCLPACSRRLGGAGALSMARLVEEKAEHTLRQLGWIQRVRSL